MMGELELVYNLICSWSLGVQLFQQPGLRPFYTWKLSRGAQAISQ